MASEGVDLITFEKGQRKDDVTQGCLRKFKKNEHVLYVGKAQERARIMRTERCRCKRTGATYPWIVDSTGMVDHYYFYCVNEDFGPPFLFPLAHPDQPLRGGSGRATMLHHDERMQLTLARGHKHACRALKS